MEDIVWITPTEEDELTRRFMNGLLVYKYLVYAECNTGINRGDILGLLGYSLEEVSYLETPEIEELCAWLNDLEVH